MSDAHDPNLGPRLAMFRARLTAAGGPTEAYDHGLSGLDPLWRWFVTSYPPAPGRLSDEAALLEVGPLPMWYPRATFLAQSLGPQLLQLADGLAAHVTGLLVADEPGADWIVESDAYIDGKVPKLRLPGRRPGPIDEVIAGLVRDMRDAPTFYQPNDPAAFVDAFLAFGDPRPRTYDTQTAKEARDLLAHVSTGHEDRLATFFDAVASQSGPRDRLDFGRESLVPLWTWLTGLPLPAQPVPDREMRRHDPPWWYSFSGVMVGQILGPDLCWLATGAADYVAAVVFRDFPGSAWTMGSERGGADFREPLLRVGSVAELNVHETVARLMTTEAVARLMPQTAHHFQQPVGPNDLHAMFDRWADFTARNAVAPERPYIIDVVASTSASLVGYSAAISFSDDTAHNESDRIDRLVDRLEGHPGVDRAYREDRELVHVLARHLAVGEMIDLVGTSWEDAARA